VREVRDHRQDVGRGEAHGVELAPVERGGAQREVHPRAVREQLAAALVAQPREVVVDAEEEVEA
jgi:hypothetical protein